MRISALITIVVLTPLVGAKPPREAMDEAVDRGLLFLRRSQNPTTGAWNGASLRGGRVEFNDRETDPAVTSLAVMAFLSAGHVPGEGRHGAAVEKGIRYVMNTQAASGLLGSSGSFTEMYHHGICTLMLAEAAGMTSGPLAEELKTKLEKAVKVLLQGQRIGGQSGPDRGGWRYTVLGIDSDLSVTGWQLMALRGCRNVGCDVPAEKITRAVEYVRRCHDTASGGFKYMTHDRVTVPCTGTGILALELCGKEHHKSPEVLAAGKYILRTNLDPAAPHFYYGVYYTSQGMFQLGDEYWKQYRVKLHDSLLKINPPRNDGAWYAGSPQAVDDHAWGPSYCTAMAVLALTVEYRYLPIYQRFEEPIEKD